MWEKGDFAESATGQERNQTWSIATPSVAREPWYENAPWGRLVRELGRSTRERALQPENAPFPITVRLEQIERSTVVSAVQFWKKDAPIEVTGQSAGNVTDANAVQSWKTEEFTSLTA